MKGRPVDEVVVSRDVPGLPAAGEQFAEREVVRAAIEKVQAQREPREARLTLDKPDTPDAPAEVTPVLKAPVAEDVEGALQVLEASLEMVITLARSLADEVGVMRQRIEAVRSKAERDAGRLKCLLDAIKQVDG
jgi:hypothetical protein